MYIWAICEKETGEIWHCAPFWETEKEVQDRLENNKPVIVLTPMPDSFFHAVIPAEKLFDQLASVSENRFPNDKTEVMKMFCSHLKKNEYVFEPSRVREEMKVFCHDKTSRKIEDKPILKTRDYKCKLDVLSGRPVEDMENYEECCLDSYHALQLETAKMAQRLKNGGLDDEALEKLKQQIVQELQKGV